MAEAMKFLTIRQPWASLIAVGAKTIETRPFSTKYRGPLAIHAGKAKPPTQRFGDFWCEPWYDEPSHVDECSCGDGICAECAAASTGEQALSLDDRLASRLPLGAVVAVCDLVDLLPIYGVDDELPVAWQHHVAPRYGRSGHLSLWLGPSGHYNDSIGRETWRIDDIEHQRPFGDFTPGRYAWLLDNVRPIDPIPMKGAQGLRDLPAEIAERLS